MCIRDSKYSDMFDKKYMYFVHSYYANCKNQKNVIANVNYNNIIMPALIQHNYSYGCQFHPEKSGPDGLKLLRGFLYE